MKYKFNWIDSQYESILQTPFSDVLYFGVEIRPFNNKWQYSFAKRNYKGNFKTKEDAKLEVEYQIKKFIEFYLDENNVK